MKTLVSLVSASVALACAGFAAADVSQVVTVNRSVQSVAQFELDVSMMTDTLVYRKANGRWRIDWNATIVSYEKMVENNEVREDFQMWTFLTTDCDENGTPDATDISNGAADVDGDAVPDRCEVAVGDLNLNGVIDQADMFIMLGWWGSINPQFGDLNRDGKVDGFDLGVCLGRFGLVIF